MNDNPHANSGRAAPVGARLRACPSSNGPRGLFLEDGTRRISAKRLEARLRETVTPFVAVTEARRALFAGMPLASFDFVVYSPIGDNWLVTCKPFSKPGVRDMMEKWQKVFGAGFASVEAKIRRDRIVFIGLAGAVIEPEWGDFSPTSKALAAHVA